MNTLTENQAYLAMYAFLKAEYALTKSGEIGSLLGSMSLLGDGTPADAAVVDQWQEAVRAAFANDVDASFRLTK